MAAFDRGSGGKSSTHHAASSVNSHGDDGHDDGWYSAETGLPTTATAIAELTSAAFTSSAHRDFARPVAAGCFSEPHQ